MVQTSYPGIYIVEVSSGAHAIVSVSTSIAAFFGRTAQGPINRAVHILDRASFVREFGGPHPSSDLFASVNLFFDNGGTDCYVVRVAHNPATAELTLKNVAGTNVLRAAARDAGTWGNNVRLEVDYNTANADDTFNLRVLQVDGDRTVASEDHTALSMNPDAIRFAPDFVTQSSRLIRLTLPTGFVPTTAAVTPGYSESRRPINSLVAPGVSLATRFTEIVAPPVGTARSRFELSLNDGPYVPINLAGPAFAGNQNAVAAEIRNRMLPQLPPGTDVAVTWETVHGDFRVLRISGGVNAQTSVRIRRSRIEDLAGPLMLGVDQGGVEVTRFSTIRPVPTATFFSGDLNTLASLRQDAFDQATLTIGAENTVIDLVDSGTPVLVTTAVNQLWYRDAVLAAITATDNNDGVREKLILLARAINRAPPPKSGVRPFRAEVWGYHLALIPTIGNQNTAIDLLTGLIGGGVGTDIGTGGGAPLFTRNTRQYALGVTGTSAFQDPASAAGLDDDGNPPDFNDYIGDPLTGTGFHALDTADIFNLMVLPGDRDIPEPQRLQIIGPASVYCAERRAFLLIDAPESWTDPNTLRPLAGAADIDALRNLVVKENAAVYYPRIVIAGRGRPRRIGASGAIAGVIARIDSTRGVWKAPAGTEAQIRSILDLEVKLSDREQGVFNKAGANALRIFPSGIVVWGARTLAGTDEDPGDWKYVPVRRFALFLEESLYRGTRWIVFEPNDEPLWANIRKNIRAFMMGLFRQGAFQGSTPDKAFYVKCDKETTTSTDQLLGIVNIEVGFAPLKPAEFVIIRIQQIADQTN